MILLSKKRGGNIKKAIILVEYDSYLSAIPLLD